MIKDFYNYSMLFLKVLPAIFLWVVSLASIKLEIRSDEQRLKIWGWTDNRLIWYIEKTFFWRY